MSIAESVVVPARARYTGLRQSLSNVTERDRVVAHRARTIAIFLAVVLVAYHYSFSTLQRTLKSNTPLAYLGLVPFIALALAATRARPAPGELTIHDRQVDYIIGVPLLVASLAVNIVLPVRLSALFWVWRVDLLALPLFVAGSVTLLFGVRTLWRLRVPIAFLIFAWPLPYTMLLINQLQTFTNATLVGVNAALSVFPGIAHASSTTDNSLFIIEHAPGPFQVSVASACSGVNGLVGYALVAAAFLAIVKGRWLRKAAWLTTGLLIIWVLNVLRIVAIFAAGKQWGEGVAIDALHPYLGLVTFSIGVLVMMLLLRRFGLEVSLPSWSARKSVGALASRTEEAPAEAGDQMRLAVPKTRLAVCIVVMVGLLSGVANASLRSFDLVSDSLGTPRLESFITHPGHPDGWRANAIAQYDWARQFFGENSKWTRYQLAWDGKSVTPFQTPATVIADVIDTDDLGSFSAYGIEACYNFHGYTLKSVNTIDLNGVVAHAVSYHNSTLKSDWTNVYWIWPVNTPDGTRYERVNLLMLDSVAVDFTAPIPEANASRSLGIQIQNFLTGGESGTQPKLTKTAGFLAALAADLVKHQTPATSTE